MPHPLARQRAARRHDDRRYRCYPGNAGERADIIGIEIGAGENTVDAGHRAGSRGVNGFD